MKVKYTIIHPSVTLDLHIDVVVIAVLLFRELSVVRTCISVTCRRTGDGFLSILLCPFFNVHSFAGNLRESICKGLRFQYEFARCDTILQFC